MTFLTSDLKYRDFVWLPIMKCPKCGYETTVTNICRSCPETPADQKLTCPVLCGTHEMVHQKDGVFLGHRSVIMEYTGKVQKLGEERTREYVPKNDDEKLKLWTGYGVVFTVKEKVA